MALSFSFKIFGIKNLFQYFISNVTFIIFSILNYIICLYCNTIRIKIPLKLHYYFTIFYYLTKSKFTHSTNLQLLGTIKQPNNRRFLIMKKHIIDEKNRYQLHFTRRLLLWAKRITRFSDFDRILFGCKIVRFLHSRFDITTRKR